MVESAREQDGWPGAAARAASGFSLPRETVRRRAERLGPLGLLDVGELAGEIELGGDDCCMAGEHDHD
jgi:hypothetical protein